MNTPLVVLLAILGGAWGFASDRISTRWPRHLHEHVHDHADTSDADHVHEHEPYDEPVEGKAWSHEHPHEHGAELAHGRLVPRRIGWRTVVVALTGALTGALTMAGLGLHEPEPVPGVVFGAYLVALVLLLATDLDQRRLPDVITLPAIPLALGFALLGFNPLVPVSALPLSIAVAIVIPVLLYLFSLPFGAGAFGLGDVKLLVSVGLMAGPFRMFSGVVYGALFAGIVLVLLLVTRRITLKSYVPFGPFLIVGAIWAILVLQ